MQTKVATFLFPLPRSTSAVTHTLNPTPQPHALAFVSVLRTLEIDDTRGFIVSWGGMERKVFGHRSAWALFFKQPHIVNLDHLAPTSASDHISDCLCNEGYTSEGDLALVDRTFLALVPASSPKLASPSTRDQNAIGSLVLPAFSAGGGPEGKGAVRFTRAQEQYLNGGKHTFKIATNGGLTVIAVVRFVNPSAAWERIIDFGNGQSNDNLMLAREDNLLYWRIYDDKGGGSKVCDLSTGVDVVVKDAWMTVVARYNNKTNTAELRVGSRDFSQACTGAVDDRTLSKTYVGKSMWTADGNSYLDADVAGLFVIDTYVDADAAGAIAGTMTKGKDLTELSAKSVSCTACPSGKYKVRSPRFEKSLAAA